MKKRSMKQLEGSMSTRGRLVVPVNLRRELHMRQGTRVRFAAIRGGIAIYPELTRPCAPKP